MELPGDVKRGKDGKATTVRRPSRALVQELEQQLLQTRDERDRARRGMDLAEKDAKLFMKEGSAEVRVLRIIEYRGPQRWVEETVRKSIHGTRQIDREKSITAVTLHEYPEQIRVARHATNIPTGSDAPAPVTDYAKGIPDTLANREPFRG